MHPDWLSATCKHSSHGLVVGGQIPLQPSGNRCNLKRRVSRLNKNAGPTTRRRPFGSGLRPKHGGTLEVCAAPECAVASKEGLFSFVRIEHVACWEGKGPSIVDISGSFCGHPTPPQHPSHAHAARADCDSLSSECCASVEVAGLSFLEPVFGARVPRMALLANSFKRQPGS